MRNAAKQKNFEEEVELVDPQVAYDDGTDQPTTTTTTTTTTPAPPTPPSPPSFTTVPVTTPTEGFTLGGETTTTTTTTTPVIPQVAPTPQVAEVPQVAAAQPIVPPTPPPTSKHSKKTMVLIAVTLFLAISIPLAVYLAQQSQEIRQRATGTGGYGWNGTCFTSIPYGCRFGIDPYGGCLRGPGGEDGNCFAVRYVCANQPLVGGVGCQGRDAGYAEIHSGDACYLNNICGTQQIDVSEGCGGRTFQSTSNYPACSAVTPSPSPSASPTLGDCGSPCTGTGNECVSDLSCAPGAPGQRVCWGSRCGGGSPPPSQPPPQPAAQCTDVRAYRVTGSVTSPANWTQLNAAQLAQLQPGDIIYVTTLGNGINGGVISRARIRVNSATFTPANETTTLKPKTLPSDPDEYYIQYTIPTTLPTPPTFTFESEVCMVQAGACQWF